MTTDKNNSPVTAPMWWDGGDRAITAREKATIEEHGPSSFSIPLVQATALQPAGLAGQQGVAFVTDAMVDAACKILHHGYDHESRKAYREACQKAARQALEAALAATGKQQVGEVQEDALVPVQPRALAASIAELEALMEGECLDPLTTSESESVMLVLHELKRLQLVAARQPGPQADEAAILRHGAAVLDMWEGDPNVTGYMGDFKDACAILEVLALHAAPPAQGIDLGQLRALIARSLAEWHEDDGNVMWWAWCGRDWAGEPAWCGTPNDSDWPGHHTHWTQHPVQPALIDGQRDAAPGVKS